MGRDPSSTHVEVKVHPRYDDDGAVHPGRGPTPSHGRRNSPPSPRRRTPRLPPEAREPTHDRDFSLFKRWFPWLVPTFVVANIVLFLVSMYVNDCPKHSQSGSCVAPFLGRFSFQPLKENPLFGPSAQTLEKMGALKVDDVIHQHQVWRLFSCIWLHGGVIHVVANMLSLIFIGIRLEQEFGFVRIGFLYVMSGFGGTLLSALFIQSGISVGASGALFGLLGGMLSELLINWTIYANKLAALLTLVVIILLNLAVGILPHVDNFAHIGGFLSGFLLGFIFLIRPQFKWVSQRKFRPRHGAPVTYKHKPYQYVLWVISFVILTAGMVTGLILLFEDVKLNDHCSWCHYLRCVPTSRWSCKAPEPVYCESSQIGNEFNLTCLSNGRSEIFPVSNISNSETQQMCTRLCS